MMRKLIGGNDKLSFKSFSLSQRLRVELPPAIIRNAAKTDYSRFPYAIWIGTLVILQRMLAAKHHKIRLRYINLEIFFVPTQHVFWKVLRKVLILEIVEPKHIRNARSLTWENRKHRGDSSSVKQVPCISPACNCSSYLPADPPYQPFG